LVVDKQDAFNKIGHSLHDLDPVFNAFSYTNTVKYLAFKVLGYKAPYIVQSMYIFKGTKIGGAVIPHKDNSFLISNPLSC